MSEKDDDYRCPLLTVDRRLEDVHRNWHAAEKSYFEPDGFRVAIQTAIQTLRTVTFILQSNKRLFPNFPEWYESWQVKLRADPLMRWMVDARNKIEKQGDLEAHSFIRAEIMASYYNEGPCLEVEAELFQNPHQLLQSALTEHEKAHVRRDGILRIQRRWVENTLPNYELLDAVGIAYGKIAELVADAHREIGLERPSTFSGDFDHTEGHTARGGRLPCMIGHSESRALNVWLATGQPVDVESTAVELKREAVESRAERYKLTAGDIWPPPDSSSEQVLDHLFQIASKLFLVDGHHDTMVFLLSGSRPVYMMTMVLQEHGEKYLIMRQLANEVIRHGTDGLIAIGEVWSSPFNPRDPYRRAADSPERREYLSASFLSKTENPVQILSEIERVDDVIRLGSSATLRNQAHNAFAPVYEAWGREVPKHWSTGPVGGTRDGISEGSP